MRGKLKSGINLFKVLEVEKKKKLGKSAVVMTVLLTVSSIVSVSTVAMSVIVDKKAQNTINNLNKVLSATDVVALIAEDEMYKKQIIANQKDMSLMDEFSTYIKTEKGFETMMYNTIDKVRPQNVSIVGFSYSNFQLSVLCETVAGNNPADFTKAVEDTKFFYDVAYKGFVESEGNKKVSFTLVCTFLDEKKVAAEKAAADAAASIEADNSTN